MSQPDEPNPEQTGFVLWAIVEVPAAYKQLKARTTELPDLKQVSMPKHDAGKLRVQLLDASGLLVGDDAAGTSDPYIRVWVGSSSQDSEVVQGSLDPRWENELVFHGSLRDFVETGVQPHHIPVPPFWYSKPNPQP